MIGEIDVNVAAEYLDSQSDPEANQYTFAYHVTIANRGGEPAQLISRHWIITDGDGNRKDVKGMGVIGEQPTIAPGDSFQYSSFSVIETTVGTMEGSYQMKDPDGNVFDASIPPFLLAVPGAIN